MEPYRSTTSSHLSQKSREKRALPTTNTSTDPNQCSLRSPSKHVTAGVKNHQTKLFKNNNRAASIPSWYVDLCGAGSCAGGVLYFGWRKWCFGGSPAPCSWGGFEHWGLLYPLCCHQWKYTGWVSPCAARASSLLAWMASWEAGWALLPGIAPFPTLV